MVIAADIIKYSPGHGPEVLTRHFAQAHQLVTPIIARILLQEEGGLFASPRAIRNLGPGSLKISMRRGKTHNTVAGLIRVSETSLSEKLHQGAYFTWRWPTRSRVVSPSKGAQVAIRAMAFHNEKPIERLIWVLCLDQAGESDPAKRQIVSTPEIVPHDGFT